MLSPREAGRQAEGRKGGMDRRGRQKSERGRRHLLSEHCVGYITQSHMKSPAVCLCSMAGRSPPPAPASMPFWGPTSATTLMGTH